MTQDACPGSSRLTIQADNGRAKRLATAFGAPSRVGQAGGQISLAFELAD